jgi:hypothetical protein
LKKDGEENQPLENVDEQDDEAEESLNEKKNNDVNN